MKYRSSSDEDRRDGAFRTDRPAAGLAAEEDGYALAVSLVAIVVVTLLATAGYSLSNFELGTARDFQAETEAFYVADRALNLYLATDAADLDTAYYDADDLGEGTATVAAEPVTLGMANNEEVHRVTATGQYVTPSGETVERTVSSLLLATPMLPVYPNGAFVAGGKFNLNGSSPRFSGYNAYDASSSDALCEAAGVQQGDSVPGVVADSFDTDSGSGGRCEDPSNDQVVDPDTECRDGPIEEFMSADQWRYIKDSIPMDRTAADFKSAGSTDGWEVVRADGSFKAGGGASGKGLLIVEEDFETTGSFTWDGLILVGGKFTSNGTEEVNGGFVVGLNGLLGENVPTSTISNGNKDYTFNSCAVFKASRSKYRVSQLPSSWYEER